jgi:GntR family transcriptional regulator
MDAPQVPPPASALPLFSQIEADLRQRIISNTLVAGSKLPREADLEAHYGVSRITVRQALAALNAAGLIEKVNGKGSFVTHPDKVPRLGPLTGFYGHMRSIGRQASGRTISVREVEAPAGAAQALGLAPGSMLTAVAMIRLADDKPLAYGIVYAPHVLMQALIREDIEANDFMSLLESPLGYRLRNIHTETSALLAGKTRARHLATAPDDPLLRVRFTPHDVLERPLLHADMYFRADGFTYKAVVKR